MSKKISKTSKNQAKSLFREKVLKIFTERQLKDIEKYLSLTVEGVVEEYRKRNGSNISLPLLIEYKKKLVGKTRTEKKLPKWLRDEVENDKYQRYNHININLSSQDVERFINNNNISLNDYIKVISSEVRGIRRETKPLIKKVEKEQREQKKHYVGNIILTLRVNFEGRKNKPSYWDDVKKTIPLDVKVSPMMIDSEIADAVENVKIELLTKYTTGERGILDVKVIYVDKSGIIPTDTNNKLENIRMKDYNAGNIDGYDNQNWDTNTGRCVFDYIIHKYKNIKGFKTICNYEDLHYILSDKADNRELFWRGVNTIEISRFCKKFKLPLYAINDEEKTFFTYEPENRNRNGSSLIFRISNKHFYPIEDISKRKTISHQDQINNKPNIKSILFDTKDITDVVLPETETIKVNDVSAELKNKLDMKIIPSSVSLYKNEIQKFKVDDFYYVEEDKTLTFKNNFASYMGYEEPSTKTLSSLLDRITNETVGVLPVSSPNKLVMDTLLEAKKSKTHYGFINGYDSIPDNAFAYDLIKSYSYSAYNIQEWLIIDFNDNWEDYEDDDTGIIKKGLYKVETDDILLFRGSGIYTHLTITKAITEGIDFIIKKQLIVKKTVSHLLNPIIDKVLEYCKQEDKETGVFSTDTDTSKFIINTFTGLLGKSNTETSRYFINNDMEQILVFINEKQQENIDYKFVIHKIPDTDYYIYGRRLENTLNENNIPMYLQIVEDNNNRVYDLMKKVGIKNVVARKVDCVITTNKLDVDGEKVWGGVRECEIPNIISTERPPVFDVKMSSVWEHNLRITDSSEWKSIFNGLERYGGLLLQGDAGKGKTYAAKCIINYIHNELNEKVTVLAPTNKAALNIGGSTIHSFLKLTSSGKINPKMIKILKNTHYIVIDEVSMLGKDLLKKLCLLKSACPHIKFLLIGDDKQIPPVEDDTYDDYFNHPSIKFLCNNTRNTLTVLKRYDEDLYNVLGDVDNINIKDFPTTENRVNICYLNKTRKKINALWNAKENVEGSLFIPEDIEEEHSQNMYVYPNLPVIAVKSRKVDKDLLFANAEEFTVVDFDEQYIFLDNVRPDINGIPKKYSVDIPINDFNKYFTMAYAITTHKAQGSTFTEDFTVWDYGKMSTKLRYTALSRGKTIKQISFSKNTIIKKTDDTDESIDNLPEICMPYKKKQHNITYTTTDIAYEDETYWDRVFKLNISRKIEGHKKYDEMRRFTTDIDVDYIINMYEKQNGMCPICNDDMKRCRYAKGDDKQFSIDRVSSKKGHSKGNIQLLCLCCNRAKQNRDL